METPINRRNPRPRHVPTPKMSERKKSLFPDGSKSPIHLPIDEDSDLGPISPLNFSSSSSQSSHQQYEKPVENTKKMEIFLNKRNLRTSFRNILNDINGSKSNVLQAASPKSVQDENEEAIISFVNGHIGSNDNATDPFLIGFDGGNKENISMKTPSEQQIRTTPNKEIQPKFRKIVVEANDQTPTSDEPIVVHAKPQKRHYISTTPKLGTTDSQTTSIIDGSPKIKLQKIDSKARTSLSFDEFIPTKSFYSSSKHTDDTQHSKIKSPEAKSISKCNLSTSSDNYRRSSFSHRKSLPRKGPSNTINRGVFHRVVKKRSKSLRGLISPTRADTKFNAIKIKLLKKSILLDKTEEERENTRITMEQVKRINNILRNMKNPIEMAQPLTVFNLDVTAADEMESIVETEPDLHDFEETASVTGPLAAKKFFKSQKPVKNIYRITNRLSASVESGGRISLLQQKIKHADFSMAEIDFTEERKEVEGIIDKLYDQLVHDDQDDHELNTSVETEPEHIDDQMEYFRSRLPPAADANELERQENLLQFLTMNYMLDDYHFKVFILEPNKYSEEAKAILDQLVVVDDPCLDTIVPEPELNSDCPMSPTSQISNMTSELVLECPMDTEETNTMPSQEEGAPNNNNNDEGETAPNVERNFQLFEKGYRDTTTTLTKTPKTKRKNKIWIPIGADQYQIDAGQKRFGATMCRECGLLYTAHEPEEEIIHLNFHNSLKLLRYKGWQNERAVAEVAEWGLLGRIIMIVGSDPKFQLNRAKSIIRMADRDLGFGYDKLHANSVVYLAIGKNIIMGFCVAEPIPKAYRLKEDTDGTTSYDINQPVPIKCGISKIWVADAFRNQGVARHLVNAVRSNFVFGYCLSFDELAFSSPTESGKILAKKLTNRSDILIYE